MTRCFEDIKLTSSNNGIPQPPSHDEALLLFFWRNQHTQEHHHLSILLPMVGESSGIPHFNDEMQKQWLPHRKHCAWRQADTRFAPMSEKGLRVWVTEVLKGHPLRFNEDDIKRYLENWDGDGALLADVMRKLSHDSPWIDTFLPMVWWSLEAAFCVSVKGKAFALASLPAFPSYQELIQARTSEDVKMWETECLSRMVRENRRMVRRCYHCCSRIQRVLR